MMNNIASRWHHDIAAFHARGALEHAITCDSMLRPEAAISQCRGRPWTGGALPSQQSSKGPLSGEARKNYTPFEQFDPNQKSGMKQRFCVVTNGAIYFPSQSAEA